MAEQQKDKIIIAGAGPVGLAAALRLAHMGHKVVAHRLMHYMFVHSFQVTLRFDRAMFYPLFAG